MNAETFSQANWTTIAEIENSGQISCIDGRHSHCVVGAPGGNIGEMILMLSATEKLGKFNFSSHQLEQLLANYASSFGRFYMHTDTHAVKRLLSRIEKDPELQDWARSFNGNTRKFFDALILIDKEMSDKLLPFLLMPEHIGCGHLKLLIQQPQKYQVRKSLVLQTLTSFFQLMWLGNRRMHWEMLEGDHEEKQVIVIDSELELEDNSAIPFACNHDNEQRFVAHSAARRFFHRRDAGFINKFVSYMGETAINADLLIGEIARLAELQMGNTLNALAKDLPVVRVVVSAESSNQSR
ncbi:MAG: hypothetical protein OEZ43_11760 [Gammaproteobacteria bacterium]|nr:hypothetical protein [Gammaproteobacteria bacterium]